MKKYYSEIILLAFTSLIYMCALTAQAKKTVVIGISENIEPVYRSVFSYYYKLLSGIQIWNYQICI